VCREFRVAITQVRPPSDTGSDPLSHIAAKVQNQVADGIVVITRARPNLFVRQLPRQSSMRDESCFSLSQGINKESIEDASIWPLALNFFRQFLQHRLHLR